MEHAITTKQYNVRGKMITIIEHGGKPWATWASLKDLAKFPAAATMPIIESTIEGGLGDSVKKTKVPKSDGNLCQGWILSKEAISTLLTARFDGNEQLMIDEISRCFELFEAEKDLPSSGGDKAESLSSPPQANKDEVEPSPEQEDSYPESIKEVCDLFNKSMELLTISIDETFNDRLKNLEMVKYADQLGDMAERISNMEEQLHEFKAQMKDFHLLIRSLKEATGSQKQTEIIGQLVHMVTHMHPEHFKV